MNIHIPTQLKEITFT